MAIRYFVFAALIVGALDDAALAGPETWSAALDSGEQLLRAGSPDKAEHAFRRAASLVMKQSKDTAAQDRCLLRLATSLALRDKTGEALSILKGLLARIERAEGARSPRATGVLLKLGSIEESAGNHEQAMVYYNKALAITEKNYGPYSPYAVGALHGMGRVSSRAGDRKSAEAHYKRAITILSKDPNGEAAAELKEITSEYGDLLKGDDTSNQDLIRDFRKNILNKGDESEKGLAPGAPSTTPPHGSNWQQQSEFQLKASRSKESEEDTAVALRGYQIPASEQTLKPAYKVVSDTLFNQVRYGLSEQQYERMIATDIDSLGQYHPSVANDLNGLAQLYIGQNRYKDAEPLLQRALNIYKSAFGARSLLALNTTAVLAEVEYHLGQNDRALSLYREALSNAEEAFGPNSVETAKVLNGLAYLYFQTGQLDRAGTFYEWAIASTERSLGQDNPLLAACLKDYAQVLRAQGYDKKADEVELRAGRIAANLK